MKLMPDGTIIEYSGTLTVALVYRAGVLISAYVLDHCTEPDDEEHLKL